MPVQRARHRPRATARAVRDAREAELRLGVVHRKRAGRPMAAPARSQARSRRSSRSPVWANAAA